MTVPNIVQGDILVVGSTEYPIRAVERWPLRGPVTSFTQAATVTASTKRAPARSSGMTGAPVSQIASLNIMPLMPINAELQQRLALRTPFTTYQTFCFGDARGDDGLRLIVEERQLS